MAWYLKDAAREGLTAKLGCISILTITVPKQDCRLLASQRLQSINTSALSGKPAVSQADA